MSPGPTANLEPPLQTRSLSPIMILKFTDSRRMAHRGAAAGGQPGVVPAPYGPVRSDPGEAPDVA
eukprot:314784-Hanusia_phi.AAC.1